MWPPLFVNRCSAAAGRSCCLRVICRKHLHTCAMQAGFASAVLAVNVLGALDDVTDAVKVGRKVGKRTDNIDAAKDIKRVKRPGCKGHPDHIAEVGRQEKRAKDQFPHCRIIT